ncbi:hypothetical protein CPBF1521_39210 [Xanthomonas arboricola pv. juglandis]|nr:hypothetical protein CPBF1521_39210 [Xanthomonas arboricola pv. juglandis]
MEPPSRVMAAPLCSTAAAPVRTDAPVTVASPVLDACPFRASVRCACRSNVDADCTVPFAVRSRPACNAIDCALSEPACCKSPPAVARNAVAAATTPSSCSASRLFNVTSARSLPNCPLLRSVAASTCNASLAIRLPRLSSVPAIVARNVLPADALPPWSRLAALICRSPPACTRPALLSCAVVVRAMLPSPANTPLVVLSRLPACNDRSRPANTCAALLSAPVASKPTSRPPCATPASARSPWLRICRSLPASSLPRLSMAALSSAIAPVLCNTASWLVVSVVARIEASPPAWPWAANVRARCACRSSVDADCRLPAAVRSRPALNASDCALSDPACCRSPAALACSVLAAATTPCSAISPWLSRPTLAASLPS